MATELDLPAITVAPAAIRWLTERCHAHGALTLILTSWARTAGVVVREARGFVPSDYHLPLGRVAGCPVFVDVRTAGACPYSGLILEVRHGGHGERSLLARGESEGECQDRVLRAWVGHRGPAISSSSEPISGRAGG